MSPRIVAIIVAIVLVIALGTALIVKRAKPGYRPGDPNAPRTGQATAPSPRSLAIASLE